MAQQTSPAWQSRLARQRGAQVWALVKQMPVWHSSTAAQESRGAWLKGSPGVPAGRLAEFWQV